MENEVNGDQEKQVNDESKIIQIRTSDLETPIPGWERYLTEKITPIRLGLSFRLYVTAIALTMALYLIVNLVCLRPWLWYSAAHVNLGAPSLQSEKAAHFLRITNGCRELESWVRDKTTTSAVGDLRQIVVYIQSVNARINKEESDSMEKQVKSLIQGRPHFLLCWLSARAVTGKEILKSVTDENWRDSLEQEDYAQEKREFLEKLLDLMAANQVEPIHMISRINGWIQILTVYIGILVGILIFLRRRLILRLEKEFQSGGKTVVLPSSQKVDDCIYKPLSYMISTMPSLGFIGTVLGMGTALLHANELFTTSDKQAAIGKMTQELGFAFDTTLIALVVAIVLGSILIWSKTREYEFLSEHASTVPENNSIQTNLDYQTEEEDA